MTCLARPDRHQADTLRCDFCRLVFDRSEEPPPRCRARLSAAAQPITRITTSSVETKFTG